MTVVIMVGYKANLQFHMRAKLLNVEDCAVFLCTEHNGGSEGVVELAKLDS